MEVRKYIRKYKIHKRQKAAGRLIKKTLPPKPYQLYEMIKDDVEFWQESYYTSEDIKGRTYVPYSLNSVPLKTYCLISEVSKFFNCLVIWDRIMVPGTSEGLNTITIYGYPYSQALCYSVLSKTLATLDYAKYNTIEASKEARGKTLYQRYRKGRWRRRRKNQYKRRKMLRKGEMWLPPKPPRRNPIKKGNQVYNTTLERLTNSWREVNTKRSRDLNRLKEIYLYINRTRGLNYRNFHTKGDPYMVHAVAKKGKFQIKRIIYDITQYSS